jgi:2-keto-4-pentenoate hydratase
MDVNVIERTARLFIEARRTGRPLDGLPAACSPATVADAHAIQDATVAGLGESIVGWKVGGPIDGQVVRGPLLASRVFRSPATVPARLAPLLGVEAEIAFLVRRDLPPRATDYAYEEVADAVVALAAIEIVDSRFRDLDRASPLERSADLVSNGGFVHGAPQPGWRGRDLSAIQVTLTIGGKVVAEKTGGHAAGDPLRPVVALANDPPTRAGFRAGLFVTTGTYTGINYAKPGDAVRAVFDGFEPVEVRFEP